MKIEQLIEKLQKIHTEHGNIDVNWWNSVWEEGGEIRVCVDEEETYGDLTREEAIESETQFLPSDFKEARIKEINDFYDSGKVLDGKKGTGRMIAYIVED